MNDDTRNWYERGTDPNTLLGFSLACMTLLFFWYCNELGKAEAAAKARASAQARQNIECKDRR